MNSSLRNQQKRRESIMFLTNSFAKLGILISTAFSLAHAADLRLGPYVFGAEGSERADIIRSMPGARPAYRMVCEAGRCEREMLGYVYRRTPELDQALQQHLPNAQGVSADALIEAAQSATSGIAADGASTAAGMAAGANELNPVLGAAPSPIALLAMALLRQQMVNATLHNPQLTAAQKADALCTNAAVSMGAAANNLAILATAGGVLPIVVGLVAGQAQHNSCMTKVHQAQQWIERRETDALKAYAAQLQPLAPNQRQVIAVYMGREMRL